MIAYRPTDGDPLTTPIKYRPRTCFLMTQLGAPTKDDIAIREALTEILSKFRIKTIDANSVVTGKDFLLKIWNLLVAVPLGIAIVNETMSAGTLANIFYELGVLQAHGKETLVVKTKAAKIPSDFVRTEYVQYDGDFSKRITSFLEDLLKQAEYFEIVADQLEKNPLLAIDYLRRAYLISGKINLRSRARQIIATSALKGRAKNSVEMLLANF